MRNIAKGDEQLQESFCFSSKDMYNVQTKYILMMG